MLNFVNKELISYSLKYKLINELKSVFWLEKFYQKIIILYWRRKYILSLLKFKSDILKKIWLIKLFNILLLSNLVYYKP